MTRPSKRISEDKELATTISGSHASRAADTEIPAAVSPPSRRADPPPADQQRHPAPQAERTARRDRLEVSYT